MIIALLGAESTGKSQLASELAAHLSISGQRAIAVGEYLREWCEREGRTPLPHEQAHIAHTQQSRIEVAAAQADWVIADTTPLMTAVYSEFIFADTSLHEAALTYQRSFELTLLTGLDMPWEADGIQRDGPHVRGPVDALIRSMLQSAGIAYEVVYGSGSQRTTNALNAISRLGKLPNTINSIALCADSMPANSQKNSKKWQWNCEKCSDPDCEHRLFSSLKLMH
ncbi:ATP-binding protein [Variovorax sp. PCZ-1]|uniref:AAA family ATPase n=1 Tax=Variovorax sp. PCZ-1 TaxID=2835533 RepID=UPI001BCBBA83|nr:ATP-binding protein [Variovorax sp. PCZ-1]MBS7808526.1 ATP-binding protein [Variovorax sp. PCZ-1]